MTLVTLGSVGVEYGATTILRDVTWTIAKGDRWGMVGRNGAGKTSLLRVVTGKQPASRGTCARQSGLRISVLDQHRDFGSAATVWEAAAGPLQEVFGLEARLQQHLERIGEAGEAVTDAMLDAYQRDLERFEQAGGYGLGARVDAVLAGLGFDPEDSRTRQVATLSGGERGRVGLVRQLVESADLLLLDEPTNHLDLDTTAWLESWLVEQRVTLVLVSHDRDFLRKVVDHVIHVEQGTALTYDGSYDHFVHQRAERRLAQRRAFEQQRKVVAAEQDYIARNIAGQNSSQAKGRRRRLDRLERLSAPPDESGAAAITFTAGSRGGDQVLVAEQVRVEMGERVLLRDFTATVRRQEVVGLIGANGAGKSTLLKTIVGERAPAAGRVTVPEGIRVAHYRQDLGDVDPARTCYELIEDRRPLWTRGQIQGHLGKYDFPGDSVLRKAGGLSGGERARLAMALLELEQAHLLCFDEPTNHLDVETIEALEDAVLAYDGTVLLISHDRELLRGLVTRVWSLESGVIDDFPGSFDEWEARRDQRKADARSATAAANAARREEQRARPADPAGDRTARKRADRDARARERAVREAESAVEQADAEVRRLEAALADPALYNAAGGPARAASLDADLARARRTYAEAMSRWEAAVEAAEGAA
jgi:ATP-binding cassette subfamily F protein 3